MSKTHGLTLKEAASKVSSSDFTPSNVINGNAERETVVSNATALQALSAADLTDIFKSMELMGEHVATLERDNTILLERLSALESKQDAILKAIESDNEQMTELMNEIKKLNAKIETLEEDPRDQKKPSLLARLFKK